MSAALSLRSCRCFSTTPNRLWLAYLGMALISLGSAYFDPAADAAVPNLVAKEDLRTGQCPPGIGLGHDDGSGQCDRWLGDDAVWSRDLDRHQCTQLRGLGAIAVECAHPFSEAATIARKSSRLICRHPRGVARPRLSPRVIALLMGRAATVWRLASSPCSASWGVNTSRRRADLKCWGHLGAVYGAWAGAVLGPFVLRSLLRDGDRMNLAIAPCIIGVLRRLHGAVALQLGFALSLAFVALRSHGRWGRVDGLDLRPATRGVPDELRGRIFAVDYGLATLAISLSSLVAGALADAYGAPRVAFIMSIVAVLWATAWLLMTYRLWDLRSR